MADPRNPTGIGQDQWVEQVDDRKDQYTGWTAPARRFLDQLTPGKQLLLVVVAATIYPFLVRGSDVRIGIGVLILAMLALGLNVVVGWAGLLDLGYIAFYGFGAYFYAIVASEQLPAHWPTWVAIPVIVVFPSANNATTARVCTTSGISFIWMVIPLKGFPKTVIFSPERCTSQPICSRAFGKWMSPWTLSGLRLVTDTSPPVTAAAAKK